jgi:hypothetical protein
VHYPAYADDHVVLFFSSSFLLADPTSWLLSTLPSEELRLKLAVDSDEEEDDDAEDEDEDEDEEVEGEGKENAKENADMSDAEL